MELPSRAEASLSFYPGKGLDILTMQLSWVTLLSQQQPRAPGTICQLKHHCNRFSSGKLLQESCLPWKENTHTHPRKG